MSAPVAEMRAAEPGLLEKVVLGEIAGKHLAIHAYDKLIWIVRSGFLTLLFTAWGLLVTFAGSSSTGPSAIVPLLIPMLLLSVSLAIGGVFIDINYVQRKFRVIDAVDRLTEILAKYGENCLTDITIRNDKIMPLLKVSGDKHDKNYKNVTGYPDARNVGFIIYIFPLVGVFFAAYMLAGAL